MTTPVEGSTPKKLGAATAKQKARTVKAKAETQDQLVQTETQKAAMPIRKLPPSRGEKLQAARDTTQIERDATQVERDDTQVERDDTQVTRDENEATRQRLHEGRARGAKKRQNRQLGAYVLIVIAGILGFFRTDQLRADQATEERRAIAAECNVIRTNRGILKALVDNLPVAVAPPGSSPEIMAQAARSRAGTEAFAAFARKELGPEPAPCEFPKIPVKKP